MTTPEMIVSVNRLMRSDRGRAVRKQLIQFLDGDVGTLDQFGRDAVKTLIESYLGPNPQSTMDALYLRHLANQQTAPATIGGEK